MDLFVSLFSQWVSDLSDLTDQILDVWLLLKLWFVRGEFLRTDSGISKAGLDS